MSATVTVIDSMMGTGKTSYAIQMMQEAPQSQQFIYVTPFLDEVERIKTQVTNREFRAPEERHGSGKKLESLKRLIASDADIVTTHALFAHADDELMDLLNWSNYTLIMDEVMEVVGVLDVRPGDVKMMLKSGAITVEPITKRVLWNETPNFDTAFTVVRDYALSGNLYAVSGTALIWNFPVKMFDLFEQVYIMTYMFGGQLQRYYYDLHDIQYEYYAVTRQGNRYELELKCEVPEERSYLKELIHVYEGPLNKVGEHQTSLSMTWFRSSRNKDKVRDLKNALYNYFRNVKQAKEQAILWTTFKDHKKRIHGPGFRKEEPQNNTDPVAKGCYTAFNLRATNKYRHKAVLAFCLNRYLNPMQKQFFQQHGVQVDEDLLALSDLLQWLFRSAVRDGHPVEIYIPSRRMRELLYRWLDGQL